MKELRKRNLLTKTLSVLLAFVMVIGAMQIPGVSLVQADAGVEDLHIEEEPLGEEFLEEAPLEVAPATVQEEMVGANNVTLSIVNNLTGIKVSNSYYYPPMSATPGEYINVPLEYKEEYKPCSGGKINVAIQVWNQTSNQIEINEAEYEVSDNGRELVIHIPNNAYSPHCQITLSDNADFPPAELKTYTVQISKMDDVNGSYYVYENYTAGGNNSPITSFDLPKGGSAQLFVVPSTDYKLTDAMSVATQNGNQVSTGAYNISNVRYIEYMQINSSNDTIKITANPQKVETDYSVTLPDPISGITVNGNSSANSGSPYELTLTGNQEILNQLALFCNGKPVGWDSSAWGNQRKAIIRGSDLKNFATHDNKLVFTLQKLTYDVNFNNMIANASITDKSGKPLTSLTNVIPGSSVTVYLNASDGYSFTSVPQWSLTGDTTLKNFSYQNGSYYATVQVNSSMTIDISGTTVAGYKVELPTIPHVRVTGDRSVAAGSDYTITLTPDDGYAFGNLQLLCNGSSVGELTSTGSAREAITLTSNQINNLVVGNKLIFSATGSAKAVTYDVNFQMEQGLQLYGSDGTTLLTQPQHMTAESNLTFYIKAEEGYKVKDVTVDEIAAGVLPCNLNVQKISDTKVKVVISRVTQEFAVKGLSEFITYAVKIVGSVDGVSVSGLSGINTVLTSGNTYQVKHGELITLTATLDSGYSWGNFGITSNGIPMLLSKAQNTYTGTTSITANTVFSVTGATIAQEKSVLIQNGIKGAVVKDSNGVNILTKISGLPGQDVTFTVEAEKQGSILPEDIVADVWVNGIQPPNTNNSKLSHYFANNKWYFTYKLPDANDKNNYMLSIRSNGSVTKEQYDVEVYVPEGLMISYNGTPLYPVAVNNAPYGMAIIRDVVHGSDMNFAAGVKDGYQLTSKGISMHATSGNVQSMGNNVFYLRNVTADSAVSFTAEAMKTISVLNQIKGSLVKDMSGKLITTVAGKPGDTVSFYIEPEVTGTKLPVVQAKEQIGSQPLKDIENGYFRDGKWYVNYTIPSSSDKISIILNSLTTVVKETYDVSLYMEEGFIVTYSHGGTKDLLLTSHKDIKVAHGDSLDIEVKLADGYEASASGIKVMATPFDVEALKGDIYRIASITADTAVSISGAVKKAAYDIAEVARAADIPDQPYTGYAIKPNVKVTLNANNVALTKDVDYTVEYKDNIKTGTAYAIIKGKGDYNGQIVQSFDITGLMDQEIVVLAAQERDLMTRTLASNNTVVKYTTKPKTEVRYSSSNPNVVYVNAKTGDIRYTGVGTATIKISAAESKVYKAATKKLTVKVLPRAPKNLKVRNTNKRKLTITADKVAEAAKYQIKIQKDGHEPVYVKVKNTGDLKKVYTTKSTGKFSVWVRAYKTINGVNHISEWSGVRRVTVK